MVLDVPKRIYILYMYRYICICIRCIELLVR